MGAIFSTITGGVYKWIIIGVAFATLAGAVYVEHLRLVDADDKLSAIDTAADVCAGTQKNLTTAAKVQSCVVQRDQAVSANAGFQARLDAVTADAAAAIQRAQAAIKQAQTNQATTAAKVAAIQKDAQHAATSSDEGPVSPGLAAAIVGLRQQFGAGAAADHH